MHNGIKKILSIISIGLILGGFIILFYPALTSLYSQLEQRRLLTELSEQIIVENLPVVVEESPGVIRNETSASGEPDPDTIKPEEIKKPAIMLLEIPALNLSVGVVKGTTAKDLRAGPGWYTQSALPGEGNTAIAGHLNIYGSWFRHLDQLKPGQEIRISYDGKKYLYEVEEVWKIKSNDWSVIQSVGYPALTLTTCDSSGDDNLRLAVRAKIKPR